MFQLKRSVLFTIPTVRVVVVAEVPGYTFVVRDSAHLGDPVFAVRDRRTRYAARLADGHRCLAFVDDRGAIVAYFWFTVAGRTPVAVPWELGAEALLPPRTAYVWDCFTVPAHRRRGLYHSGILRLAALGSAEGAVTAAIVARAGNAASVGGITAAGFTVTGRYVTVRIGKIIRIYHHWSMRCINPSREQFMLDASS